YYNPNIHILMILSKKTPIISKRDYRSLVYSLVVLPLTLTNILMKKIIIEKKRAKHPPITKISIMRGGNAPATTNWITNIHDNKSDNPILYNQKCILTIRLLPAWG